MGAWPSDGRARSCKPYIAQLALAIPETGHAILRCCGSLQYDDDAVALSDMHGSLGLSSPSQMLDRVNGSPRPDPALVMVYSYFPRHTLLTCILELSC